MPSSGILLMAAIAVSPADAALSPGESMTFGGTGGSGSYAFTLVSSPSGGTIDPVSGIYTAGPIRDVDDVVTLRDDEGHTSTATVHVLADPPAEQTATGVPRHSVNIAGGGPADNACDCGTVGANGSRGDARGAASLLAVLGLTLFARRRRIE